MAAFNEIIIPNKELFENDLYLVRVTDSNGELSDVKIFSDEDIEYFTNKFPDLKISKEKLSDSEKEYCASAVFAHEIRHCIQKHLIAATDESKAKENFMAQITGLKQAIEELIKLEKDLAKIKNIPYVPSENEENLKKLDYWLVDYKPKKVFDKDTLFKFSLFPSDNRYWSVNHLQNTNNPDGNKNQEAYYNSPLEIDAYNYEFEFLITQKDNYPKGALREDIAKDMCLAAKLRSNYLGFPFIRK